MSKLHEFNDREGRQVIIQTSNKNGRIYIIQEYQKPAFASPSFAVVYFNQEVA